MVVLQDGNYWKVHAPAKLNLHLEILAKRSDGFHEIETLMVPVSIYDTLLFTPLPTPELHLTTRWAYGLDTSSLGELPPEKDNLVYRALERLQASAGILPKVSLGARVELIKRIPSQAGLGGASTDAAAALLAANAAWKLGWSTEQLAEIAAQLGSDIPYFLYNGAAICRGRGEQIESVGILPPLPVVVVRPPEGLSTPQVYRACRAAEQAMSVAPLLQSLRLGHREQIATRMMNRLQAPAERLSRWVGRLRAAFAESDCIASQMSGSGSSYFGIYRSARQAQRAAERLRTIKGCWVASGMAGGRL